MPDALKPADFHILMALTQGPRHGYALMKEVERESQGGVRLEIGSLYRLLARLLDSGLIEEAEALMHQAVRLHRFGRFQLEAAIQSAREAARTAPSLEALRALLENFEGCALKSTATRLVFADGNPQARIMFVGEAPGREEDIEGLPFVGRSGKLLDRMIAAIGLDRSSVYIANVIPWRPPGNRTPTPQETQICLPFIQRQIELVNPDVLVTLGNPSTQTLLSTREGIMKTRGRWFDYDTGTRIIRAIATFHPAYLLRSPSYKRMAWQDLRAIAKALAEGVPASS